MTIERISIYLARLPLRIAVAHASERRTSSEHIFAVVHLEDGTKGVGEGLPRPYVTGETTARAWQALESFRGRDLVDAWPSLESLEEVLRGLWPGEKKAPSARSALELALLDALGKKTAKPAASLVAEHLAVPPPSQREIAYSAVVPFAREALLKGLCLAARAWGIPSVKLKLGRSLEEDRQTLKAARRWLGRKVELRVDVNGAWSPKETCSMMDALRQARVACLEQPVSPSHWLELAELLPRPSPIALMADESVCSLEDLKELAEGSCLQAVNCRVAKMGGLLEAARAGKAASELRLDILVGCHVGESPVLASAGRHLASLLPEARWFEAPMESWLHRISLAPSPGSLSRGGKAQIELKPGLGLQVRLDLLERIALKRLRLWPSEA